MPTRTKQKYLTLSRADAAALAKGELREVYVAMRQNIGHRQQPLPLNGDWMVCDETAQCPSEGWRLDPPYRVGEVLGVKEPFALHESGDEYRLAYASDGECVGIMGDGDSGWMLIHHGWCCGLATHQNDGNWVGRSLYGKVRPGAQMIEWAIRNWLRVVSVEPAQVKGKWKWKVGVEKASKGVK